MGIGLLEKRCREGETERARETHCRGGTDGRYSSQERRRRPYDDLNDLRDEGYTDNDTKCKQYTGCTRIMNNPIHILRHLCSQ